MFGKVELAVKLFLYSHDQVGMVGPLGAVFIARLMISWT